MKHPLPLFLLFPVLFSCTSGPAGQDPASRTPAGEAASPEGSISRQQLLEVLGDTAFQEGEYNGYHVQFSFRTSEETRNGYTYIASHYFDIDSLNSPAYLKQALSNPENRDSLIFFRKRFAYAYTDSSYNTGQKLQIYYLADRATLPVRFIQDMKIVKMVSQSYNYGISNLLLPSDTTWMKKEPVRSIRISGHLCSHLIFIHEESKITEQVIRELQKINSEEPEPGQEEETDTKISKTLQKLKGQKIVVLTECTC
jgi:hypothetical protein